MRQRPTLRAVNLRMSFNLEVVNTSKLRWPRPKDCRHANLAAFSMKDYGIRLAPSLNFRSCLDGSIFVKKPLQVCVMTGTDKNTLPSLMASLKEVQDTVRAYDMKAQIVGVGYIFAIGIIINLGTRRRIMTYCGTRLRPRNSVR